jgi:ribonuclease BN (tRNA processing enzyme)
VAEYSKILATAIGMDEDEVELLKQASPMHDVGKIAIPDDVLKKPGGFTKSERAMMEGHAKLGYEMLKNSKRKLLKAAAIVAYEHHEKWDGSGYPRGLKGEDIHIYGRITAVADVFDALGSDRVYKKAWPDEKIFKLFKEEKGKHFDPKLVDAFFDNIDKILEVRESFKDTFEEELKKEKKHYAIEVLGAYGTRAKGFGTSSFLLNQNNVIDAGNLIETLEEFSAKLDTIWVTHSHLDHIADIAYVLDNYYQHLESPITIAALPKTVEALKKSFFNDKVWPDFSRIKLLNNDKYCIKYKEIETEVKYKLSENESIEAFRTDHTVESCGYIYTKEEHSILISSDTYNIDNIIERLNNDKKIKSAVFECSFPSKMKELAKISKHLTAEILFKELEKLKRDDLQIYINHIKPIYLNEIIKEIEYFGEKFNPIITTDKKFINF